MQIVTRLQSIDVEDARKVFGLVDHALRPELLALDGEALSRHVGRDETRGDRALEHPVQTPDREASLGRLFDLIAHPFELGFDRDDARVVHVHDGDAERHADLWRRDTDAASDGAGPKTSASVRASARSAFASTSARLVTVSARFAWVCSSTSRPNGG